MYSTHIRYSLFLLMLIYACGTGDTSPDTMGTNTGGDALPAETETTRPAPGAVPTGPVVESEGELTYELLQRFPESVEGCSCALRPDGEEDRNKYLLAYGYDGPAVIRINGEEIVFTSAPEEVENGDSDNSMHHRFQGERYQLEVMITNEGRSGDEVWDYSGTLLISDTQTGAKRKIRILGECGC